MARSKIVSVGIEDCNLDTFTVGGNGGGGKDTSNTGVRLTHEPSGAIGRAVDARSQLMNKRLALERLSKDPKFLIWVNQIKAQQDGKMSIEQQVDEAMESKNLKIEGKDLEGRWVALDAKSL